VAAAYVASEAPVSAAMSPARMHELEIALGLHGGTSGLFGVMFRARGLPADLCALLTSDR
jgi:hypothetical protein